MVNENVKPKRPPGRPPGRVQGEFVGFRLPPDLLAAVDAHAEREGMKRSEAMRQLIERGLGRDRLDLAGAIRAYLEEDPSRLGPWGFDEGTTVDEAMAQLVKVEGRLKGPLAIVASELRGMCPDDAEPGEAAAQLRAILGPLKIEDAFGEALKAKRS